jgi:acetyl esterase
VPLLAGLVPLVDALAAAPAMPMSGSIAEARVIAHEMADRTFRDLQHEVPPVLLEGDDAAPDSGYAIPLRIYRPRLGQLPVHVYLHGGGFWLGTLDQSDANCRRLARESDRVVVSVDYRLAPEHKFPVPVEDCYAALLWTVEHAADLDVDPLRLTIGGGSAGGGLAAAVALMARDRHGPSIRFQLLEIPVTDLTMSQPSIDENANGPVLTRASIATYVSLYLADDADATNPYASPLLAPDLTGLPPALVTVAEYDPLRDEGEAYARRLAEAGVDVRLVHLDGHFHGSFAMSKLIPQEAQDYSKLLAAALRDAVPADAPTDALSEPAS